MLYRSVYLGVRMMNVWTDPCRFHYFDSTHRNLAWRGSDYQGTPACKNANSEVGIISHE